MSKPKREWRCVIEYGVTLMNRYTGRGSNPRVAAQRALALLLERRGYVTTFENVTIHLDRVEVTA